jgi:hypothetical protein
MHIDTKNGRVYAHQRDSISMEQRFWKAEVRGRTVITTMDGHFCEIGTTEKSYPNEAAADRAARADYAKKLRVGFLPIPEAELIPLMRLVFSVGYRGKGSRGHHKTFGRPSKNVVYACRIQKYWRGQWRRESFFTTHGDIGGETMSKTFPQTDKGAWAMHLDERKHVRNRRGWYQSERKELAPIERYIKAMNKRLAKQPTAPVDLPAPEPPVPTIVPRKLTRATSSR